MAEFVLVTFPTKRSVRIDDQQTGTTNVPIQVGGGHHKVDLGPGGGYTPPVQHVEVRGCPIEAPKVVPFLPV